MLSITESEYVEFSECAQEVSFASMFLGEMTEVQKPSIIYEDIQGDMFLEKNRQVGIHTKHIDISHHFLWDIVEDKDIYIQYIRGEDNPEYIMTKNTSEADFIRYIKIIVERELWEIVDTGRKNVKNNRVTDDVITRDNYGYFSHTPAEFVDGKNRNEGILITRSRAGK